MITEKGKYIGPFVNGEMEGIGSFIWDDGKIYNGEFKQGMMWGKGQLYFPNQMVIKGIW